MTDPIIPTLSKLIEPGVTALLTARPGAGQHLWKGRWGDVVRGLRAQAALLRRQLADECAAARLPLALDNELRELASSEFWAELDPNPTHAVGSAVVAQETVNANPGSTHNFGTSGVIEKGTRFSRPASAAAAWPEYSPSTYETTERVLVEDVDTVTEDASGGNWRHVRGAVLPVRAVATGPNANTVRTAQTFEIGGPWVTDVVLVDSLFDSKLQCQWLSAAGGSDGLTPDRIIRFAKAMAVGRHGPTNDALIAGALSHPGVARAAVLMNYETAVTRLWIADPSWAASAELAATVEDLVLANWAGFGARVSVQGVVNVIVRAKATVVVAPNESVNTADLAKAISKSTQEHLDSDHWWTWSTDILAARAAQADPRILACSSFQITSVSGGVYPPPPAELSATSCNHYMLDRNGVDVTVEGP